MNVILLYRHLAYCVHFEIQFSSSNDMVHQQILFLEHLHKYFSFKDVTTQDKEDIFLFSHEVLL